MPQQLAMGSAPLAVGSAPMEDQDRILVAPDLSASDAVEVRAAAAAPPRLLSNAVRWCLLAAAGCAVVGLGGRLFPADHPARNLQTLFVVAFVLALAAAVLGLPKSALAGGRAIRSTEQEAMLEAHRSDYLDIYQLPWFNRQLMTDLVDLVRRRWGAHPPGEVAALLWQVANAHREARAEIGRHRGNSAGEPETMERTWREAGDGIRKLSELLGVDPKQFWDYEKDDEPHLTWCSGPVGRRP
ncbi:MAG: hypothetical protein ACRDWI_03525 [Jiangellaceae bacterium]